MAEASQIEESKMALDNVKNTITEMEDKVEHQRHHIQSLKAQNKFLRRQRREDILLLEADKRNRMHLTEISREYNEYRGSISGTFANPNDFLQVYTPTKRQQMEKKWFEWVKKELQFAKEMRETFKRVEGSSTGVSGSTCSKRFCDDSSSGLVYGERKRLRF